MRTIVCTQHSQYEFLRTLSELKDLDQAALAYADQYRLSQATLMSPQKRIRNPMAHLGAVARFQPQIR
jgi:hypothetical protein